MICLYFQLSGLDIVDFFFVIPFNQESTSPRVIPEIFYRESTEEEKTLLSIRGQSPLINPTIGGN